jgi:hypothetical protein
MKTVIVRHSYFMQVSLLDIADLWKFSLLDITDLWTFSLLDIADLWKFSLLDIAGFKRPCTKNVVVVCLTHSVVSCWCGLCKTAAVCCSLQNRTDQEVAWEDLYRNVTDSDWSQPSKSSKVYLERLCCSSFRDGSVHSNGVRPCRL